jgi:predicted secreted protein
MAVSQAMIGYNTRVFIESANSPGNSPPTYVEMDEILNVTPPNLQVDEVEVTHNTSPNRTKEFIAGMIDPGDAGFEMNFIPGSVSDVMLRKLQQNGTRVSTKFQFPNGVFWTFLSIVKGYETASETQDKMTATISLKTAGSVTGSTG